MAHRETPHENVDLALVGVVEVQQPARAVERVELRVAAITGPLEQGRETARVALGHHEVEIGDLAGELRGEPIGGQQPDCHPADQPGVEALGRDEVEEPPRLLTDVGKRLGHSPHHELVIRLGRAQVYEQPEMRPVW